MERGRRSALDAQGDPHADVVHGTVAVFGFRAKAGEGDHVVIDPIFAGHVRTEQDADAALVDDEVVVDAVAAHVSRGERFRCKC